MGLIITDDIIIVGTSFSQNGSGVPDMNSIFFKNISSRISVEKLDILKEATHKFPRMNGTLSRNLYLLGIKKKLMGKNIHVMHTIDLFNTMPLLDLSRYSRKKIITVHDFYPFYRKPDETFTFRFADFLKRRCYDYLESYDHIFVRNNEISRTLISEYEIDRNAISIQGPIIGYEYSPTKMHKDGDKVIIGYINNFNWNKAPMLKYFINTFKTIRSNELELHIYGSGFPFQELIREDSRIKYFGFLEDHKVPQTLGSFNAYLSTSTIEGFSIPIAKAKAMEIPILSYDGNLPEITKRNTFLWNEHILREIIRGRLWEKVDTYKAYLDVANLRPERVAEQTIEVYTQVFGQ